MNFGVLASQEGTTLVCSMRSRVRAYRGGFGGGEQQWRLWRVGQGSGGDPLVPPSEALRPAVVAYIVKPVSREQLLATVTTGVAWSLAKTRVH